MCVRVCEKKRCQSGKTEKGLTTCAAANARASIVRSSAQCSSAGKRCAVLFVYFSGTARPSAMCVPCVKGAKKGMERGRRKEEGLRRRKTSSRLFDLAQNAQHTKRVRGGGNGTRGTMAVQESHLNGNTATKPPTPTRIAKPAPPHVSMHTIIKAGTPIIANSRHTHTLAF